LPIETLSGKRHGKSLKCYILKDYGYAGVYLRSEKLITPEEHELIYKYEFTRNQKYFNELKKVYEKKIQMMQKKYPCLVKDMLLNMDKMKSSFVIPLIKTEASCICYLSSNFISPNQQAEIISYFYSFRRW
jgi:hypothetical protein